MPLNVNLTTEEKVRVTAAPTTASGAPAQIEGNLEAALISGSGSSLPGDTNLQVQLLAGSDITQPAVFRIFADADLGAGVVPIEDTVTLNISGAMAANLGLSVSTPEPQ